MIAKFSLSAFIVFTVFVSCSENDQTEESGQTYNSRMVADTNIGKTTVADPSLQKPMLLPGATLPVSGANGGEKNPAHGMPGHRCDIAEGAPLNSKSLPANAAPVPPSVNTTQLPVATNNSVAQKTANGINPAHGQPGHRCEIAVGAPLDSKPAPKTAAPAVATTAVPASATVSPVGDKVAPGMNPAHGQPGHRCDIAVGAPLNSKPTTPAIPAVPAKPDSSKK